MLTKFEIGKIFEPYFEHIRLCNGDSEEEFKPHKAGLIDYYSLLWKIAEEIYDKENPPSFKEPEIKSPEEILQGRVQIPEDTNARIAGKETIYMPERFGQVLGTREAATPLCEKLKSNITNNIHTKLNFKGVIYTDASFVDECIAKVLIEAGEEHFYHKVSIVSANKQVKDMISYVIKSRKEFIVSLETPGAKLQLPDIRAAESKA